MACTDKLWFMAVVVCSVLAGFDSVVYALCDVESPVTETAYVGPYEIRFPEFPLDSDPPHCQWLISAFRHEYVIHLDFEDVVLDKDTKRSVCLEEISVYDGPATSNTVLASFCGREEPTLVTSSRDTLVVFRSNGSSLRGGSFKLKYKAIKERYQGGDTNNILRVAFGSFIGSIGFLVIFSWALRKYKQAWPHRAGFLFGSSRINTSNGNGRGQSNVCDAAGSGDASVIGHRVAPQLGGRPRRVSFKEKFTGFFQDVVIKLSPRRMALNSSTVENGANDRHQQLHRQQPPQDGRGSLGQDWRGSLTCTSVRTSDGQQIHQPRISQYPLDTAVTDGEDIRDGHMAFNYAIIPLSSFTSDPEAVRPPNYEDCINSVNPLYLHHHNSQVFFNRAFDLKDERSDCVQIFSPPPPYSEIGYDTPMQSVTGATYSTGAATYHNPPQYEIMSPGSPIGTTQETDVYEQAEYSCERAETVQSTTQGRSIVSRPTRDTSERFASLQTCEPLTSVSLVQPAALSEPVSSAMSINERDTNIPVSESIVKPVSTAPAIRNPKNESVPRINTATTVPVELLRRSGLIPSQPTNTILWNGGHQNEASLDETFATPGSFVGPTVTESCNAHTDDCCQMGNNIESEQNKISSNSSGSHNK